MKQIFITTLFLSFTHIFAQETPTKQISVDWSPDIYQVGKLYPGYIIKLDGDTIKGFIKADSRCSIGGVGTSNQNIVAFYLNEGDKKAIEKYRPSDIKGYKIADKLYESIAYSGGLLKKPNFNIVVQDGVIRTYEWYSTVENYMTLRQQSGETWQEYDSRCYETKTLFAKNPEEPIELGTLGMQFSKKMPELIDDNPEMAQKVANKEKGYKFIDMFAVIEEYNKWAASKN